MMSRADREGNHVECALTEHEGRTCQRIDIGRPSDACTHSS